MSEVCGWGVGWGAAGSAGPPGRRVFSRKHKGCPCGILVLCIGGYEVPFGGLERYSCISERHSNTKAAKYEWGEVVYANRFAF